MMNKGLESLIITVLAATAYFSCNKNEAGFEGPDLSISSDQNTELIFARAGGSAILKFNAGKTWTIKAQGDPDWLKIAPTGGGAGNMETEGVQVKNGNLYIGFSPVVGGDGYHMWIFGYRL